MKSRPLFAVREDMQQLMDAVGDGGELEPVLDEYMGKLMDEEAQKLDGCIAILKEWEMEANQAKEEAKYWRDRASIRENAIGRMKDRLLAHLTATGRTEALSATRRKLKITANGGVIPLIAGEIDSYDALPPECVKVVKSPNTERIREMLSAGLKVPFFTLGERGTHVRIS